MNPIKSLQQISNETTADYADFSIRYNPDQKLVARHKFLQSASLLNCVMDEIKDIYGLEPIGYVPESEDPHYQYYI